MVFVKIYLLYFVGFKCQLVLMLILREWPFDFYIGLYLNLQKTKILCLMHLEAN